MLASLAIGTFPLISVFALSLTVSKIRIFLDGVQPSKGIAINTALISHATRLESVSGPMNDDQGAWPCPFGVLDLGEPCWNVRIE